MASPLPVIRAAGFAGRTCATPTRGCGSGEAETAAETGHPSFPPKDLGVMYCLGVLYWPPE